MPTKETGLGVEYDYNDADGDSEQGTTIRWFRDGLQIAQINDMKSVPDVWISKGQEWRVEVTPSDYEDCGKNSFSKSNYYSKHCAYRSKSRDFSRVS